MCPFLRTLSAGFCLELLLNRRRRGKWHKTGIHEKQNRFPVYLFFGFFFKLFLFSFRHLERASSRQATIDQFKKVFPLPTPPPHSPFFDVINHWACFVCLFLLTFHRWLPTTLSREAEGKQLRRHSNGGHSPQTLVPKWSKRFPWNNARPATTKTICHAFARCQTSSTCNNNIQECCSLIRWLKKENFEREKKTNWFACLFLSAHFKITRFS